MLPALIDLSVLCHSGLGSLAPEKHDMCWRETGATPTVMLGLTYHASL